MSEGGRGGGAQTVARRLRERIRRHGPLPFALFMEEALYGEGGYYLRPQPAIGEAGDFITGSSVSPLFARTTHRLLQRLDGVLEGPAEMLEVGYGTGHHLAEVATAAAGEGRRLRGVDRATRRLPPDPAVRHESSGPEGHWPRSEEKTRSEDSGRGRGQVEVFSGLDQVADRAVEGLVFAYELFDALPVHRLIGLAGGGLGELLVGRGVPGGHGHGESDHGEPGHGGSGCGRPGDGEPGRGQSGDGQAGHGESGDGEVGRREFSWVSGALSDPDLKRLLPAGRGSLEPGQIADLAPGWKPLYRQLARKLGRGLLVVCDYGFERHRLLDPRVRRNGTLACHSRHRVHRDPFVRVGEQDLTAHVDFTALREAGEAEGLDTVAFTRQARWLTACGLFDELEGADDATRRQAMRLLDGEGMGEELRVLVQARGVTPGELLPLDILNG